MTSLQREDLAGRLIAGLWAAAPLYPSFVALMPVAPPGFSLLSPLASAVILGCVLLAILGVLTLLIADQAVQRLFGPLQRSIWIYAALVIVISLCGLAPGFGLLYALFVVSTGIGMTALLHWGKNPRFARRMSSAMLLSSGLAAWLALILWTLHWPAALYAVGNGRAIGCFVVPGELAGYMGMFLPYALGVALTTSARTERLLALGVAGSDALAMMASVSRAGLLGLALGLSLLVARLGRVWLAGYLLALLGIGFVLRHHGLDVHHNPAEDTNRLAIWIAALRVALLFPLFGVGPGGFARVYPLVRLPDGEPTAFHGHSLILSTLAETGIVGLWALLQLWGRFAVEFRRAYRNATDQGKTLGLAIIAGFVGTWLQSSIDVVQILVLGLWIPFMGMALLALHNDKHSTKGENVPVVRSDQPWKQGTQRAGMLMMSLVFLAGCSSSQKTPEATASHQPMASASPTVASATPPVLPTPQTLPEVVLRAQRRGSELVSIVVVQGRRRLYTIDADSNESERTSEGAYHSTFMKPVLVFYNRDGTKMRATATKATVDGTSKVVTMLGNVVLHAQDGTVLQCDQLRYDDRHDQVEGWTGVLVTTRQGDTLRGEHLTGDLHLEHVHIDGVGQES